MRGLVAALNLFNSAIAYAVGLACAGLIRDPLLTWDFGAPAIIGFVTAAAFYWIYRDIDKEEYTLTKNGDYHLHLADKAVSVGETSDRAPTPEITEKEAPVHEAVADEKKAPEIKE